MFGNIALTSLALQDWSPHYALIPAAGASMLAGSLLRDQRTPIVGGILAVFLWLGIALRDTTTKPTIPSEMNFQETAQALGKVEHGFKRLHPALPPKSHVYVSVQARGHGGIYRQLFRFQPLRVWYGHPEIWLLDPNRYRSGAEAEFLFWITPQLEVIEIDLGTLEPRGASGPASLPQYRKTLRGYAFGLTAAGRVDRAVEIMTRMPQTSEVTAIFDRRSAAMLLIAVGREPDAARFLSNVPAFDHAGSIAAVSAVLIEPVAGLDLDEAAMRAFGLDPTDASTIRGIMIQLGRSGSIAAAARFARRLQAIDPRDPSSAAVLRQAGVPRQREITAPILYDVPQ